MAQVYTVWVSVNYGAHYWIISNETAPTYGLMDPLTVTWSLPDTEHRPNQPDAMVASFSVIVPTAGDLDDILIGAEMSLHVWFGPNRMDYDAVDLVFYGRVSQAEAAPDPRGMIYRFTCADLTADLSGYTTGVDPYAVEAVASRTSTMLARAGLAEGDLIRDPIVSAVDVSLNTEAIAAPAGANMLTSLIELWDSVALPGLGELSGVSYRAILAPYPYTGTLTSFGAQNRWALDAIPDAYVPSAAAPLPGTFGHYFPDPQGYGVSVNPDDRAAGVFDACFVEFDAAWSALQSATTDRASVTWIGSTSVDPTVARRSLGLVVVETSPPAGHTPSTATRDTQIFSLYPTPPDHSSYVSAVANARRLGDMMIPPPQNPAGWSPDSFRWLLYKDEVIVVAGIPGMWNPADGTRDWVAGQLSTVTLTIADGQPVIDFELAPSLPDTGNPTTTADTWNAQVGTWNAQVGTWDDKPSGLPAFRWTDPGLAGVKWNQLYPQPWNTYRLARAS
jgi:hypothetical protein